MGLRLSGSTKDDIPARCISTYIADKKFPSISISAHKHIKLLISQRLNRVESCRFFCRIKARKQANGGTKYNSAK